MFALSSHENTKTMSRRKGFIIKKVVMLVLAVSVLGTLGFAHRNRSKMREMENQQITVVYKWIAKDGKAEALKAIYRDVEKQMKETEPGALDVQCYFDESTNTLVVSDLFANAEALGFHLGVTAAAHFPSLLEVATPGPFLFCGEVPQEMQQAAKGMGLDATFAPSVFGFRRD
jgi:quinol monooxygenase YgiN